MVSALLSLASALAVPGVIGLACARRRSRRRKATRATLIAGAAGGYSTSGALAVAALAGLLLTAPADGFGMATHIDHAIAGAFGGLTLFVGVRLLAVDVGTGLWRWSCRLPREMVRPWGDALAATSLELAGCVLLFSLFMVVLYAAEPYGLALWVASFLVALLPLYNTLFLPWFQYARAPTLAAERLTELETWVETIRRERRLPRIRVRVQNGTLANAFALRGLGGHLIVLGKGLITQVSAVELQAITAHEVAHAARRDIVRLLPVIMAGAALHCVFLINVSHPFFATEQTWGLLAGCVLAGLSGAAFCLYGPGFFMRRMEFGADRLAAELLGDGEPLAQALERLCEISDQPLTQRSWSHPSMQARIDALRSLA